MFTSHQRREVYDRKRSGGLSIAGGPDSGQMAQDRLMELLDSEHGLNLARYSRERSMADISGVGGMASNMITRNLGAPAERIMDVVGRGGKKVAGIIEFLERLTQSSEINVKRVTGMAKHEVRALINRLRRK